MALSPPSPLDTLYEDLELPGPTTMERPPRAEYTWGRKVAEHFQLSCLSVTGTGPFIHQPPFSFFDIRKKDPVVLSADRSDQYWLGMAEYNVYSRIRVDGVLRRLYEQVERLRSGDDYSETNVDWSKECLVRQGRDDLLACAHFPGGVSVDEMADLVHDSASSWNDTWPAVFYGESQLVRCMLITPSHTLRVALLKLWVILAARITSADEVGELLHGVKALSNWNPVAAGCSGGDWVIGSSIALMQARVDGERAWMRMFSLIDEIRELHWPDLVWDTKVCGIHNTDCDDFPDFPRSCDEAVMMNMDCFIDPKEIMDKGPGHHGMFRNVAFR
jgi:hypothetical protein